MEQSRERAQRQLLEHCEQLTEHVKLLRDYALTPDNVWLARGELTRIADVTGEIEGLLETIKRNP